MNNELPGGLDQELWDLSQKLYPNLPPIEAYLEFNRDYMAPFAKAAMNGSLTLTMILACLMDPSKISNLQGLYLIKESVEKLSPHIYSYCKEIFGSAKSTATVLTDSSEKEISAQLSAEIWKRYKAGTLGQPSQFLDGVQLDKAVAPISGESLKNASTSTSAPMEMPGNNTSASTSSASSVPTESIFDHINYLECWNTAMRTIQTAQAQKIIKSLDVIAENLGDSNCIAVMGAGGPDGFARPIYDLIMGKIHDIDAADRKNHRFFLYHDSNNWHPIFKRLTRDHPLPSEFINNPCDDLDHVCLFMREVRQKLIAKDEKHGKNIMFHLIIPSWSKLHVKEPLHFPEDLYPLQLEGLKHGGKDQVKFNLPAAPAGLLHGISNVLDPNHWNKIANGATVAVGGPAVGWGVNGACLAAGVCVGTLTGAGALLAIPIWFGSGSFCMMKSAPIIFGTIHETLREEDPRVLGSNERLKAPRQYGLD